MWSVIQNKVMYYKGGVGKVILESNILESSVTFQLLY